jgi:hypothetical protein
MSGEIARALRTKLWTLRLRPRDEANRHINDFILYSDRLKELDREEREEKLIDLFLDSIVDTKYAVLVASCRLSEKITLEECYEAIRKYDNVITRENIKEDNIVRFNKLRRLETGTGDNDNNADISYKPYKEWMKLTPEQRKEIRKARSEAQGKGLKGWNQGRNDSADKNTEAGNRYKNKKRQRRVAFQDEEQPPEPETPEAE